MARWEAHDRKEPNMFESIVGALAFGAIVVAGVTLCSYSAEYARVIAHSDAQNYLVDRAERRLAQAKKDLGEAGGLARAKA